MDELNIEGIRFYHFYMGGYFIGYPNVKIIETDGKVEVFMDHGFSVDKPEEISPEKINFTENDFRLFLAEVSLLIQDWDKRYVNHDILDGTQWGMTITYHDLDEPQFADVDYSKLADTVVLSGSNAFPDNFKTLFALMAKYGIKNEDLNY